MPAPATQEYPATEHDRRAGGLRHRCDSGCGADSRGLPAETSVDEEVVVAVDRAAVVEVAGEPRLGARLAVVAVDLKIVVAVHGARQVRVAADGEHDQHIGREDGKPAEGRL